MSRTPRTRPPRTDDLFTPPIRAALAELLLGYRFATDARADPWHYATDLEALLGLRCSPRELRWLVDPNDLARPLVYDPDDSRWSNPKKDKLIREFCGG